MATQDDYGEIERKTKMAADVPGEESLSISREYVKVHVKSEIEMEDAKKDADLIQLLPLQKLMDKYETNFIWDGGDPRNSSGLTEEEAKSD